MSDHPTIAALRLTAPHKYSTLPFHSVGMNVLDSRNTFVSFDSLPTDAAHIAAAVNAAPHLLAEVDRLRAEIAKLKAPNTDAAIHPDGCFSTDPADAADCNGDGHYSCKSCKRLEPK